MCGAGTLATAFPGIGAHAFRLHVPQRQRLLAAVDLLVVNLALLLGLHVTLGIAFAPATVAAHPAWFATFSVLWLTIAAAGDNYNGWRSVTPGVSLLGIGKALALTELLYLALPVLTPPLPPTRLLLLYQVVLTALPLVLWRLLFATVFAMPGLKRRVIIVGAGQSGRTIARALRESEPSHLVAGFVDDDPVQQGKSVEGIPVLGRSADLGPLVAAQGATDLVFAITYDVGGRRCARCSRATSGGFGSCPCRSCTKKSRAASRSSMSATAGSSPCPSTATPSTSTWWSSARWTSWFRWLGSSCSPPSSPSSPSPSSSIRPARCSTVRSGSVRGGAASGSSSFGRW